MNGIKLSPPTFGVEHIKSGEKKVVTKTLIVGRTEGFQISDPRMSSKHCEFIYSEDGLILIDLGSRNGTFVDGKRIEPGEPILCTLGTQILVADTYLRVCDLHFDEELPSKVASRFGLGRELFDRQKLAFIMLVIAGALFAMVLFSSYASRSFMDRVTQTATEYETVVTKLGQMGRSFDAQELSPKEAASAIRNEVLPELARLSKQTNSIPAKNSEDVASKKRWLTMIKIAHQNATAIMNFMETSDPKWIQVAESFDQQLVQSTAQIAEEYQRHHSRQPAAKKQ